MVQCGKDAAVSVLQVKYPVVVGTGLATSPRGARGGDFSSGGTNFTGGVGGAAPAIVQQHVESHTEVLRYGDRVTVGNASGNTTFVLVSQAVHPVRFWLLYFG